MYPPPPPPPPPPPFPALDATYDRIVAALTHRLAQTARQIEAATPTTEHDFLVPLLYPELADAIALRSS